MLTDANIKKIWFIEYRHENKQKSWRITVRDIQRKQWRHLTQNTDVQRAIDWLEGEGWLIRIEHPSTAQGGRPSTSYKINPKLKYM